MITATWSPAGGSIQSPSRWELPGPGGAEQCGGAIGLLDGASQFGAPLIPDALPADARVAWSGGEAEDFLPDQACYVAGTRLLTTRGERAVERLMPGDTVITQPGLPESARHVVWMAQRVVDPAAFPAPEQVVPLRIRRDAFGFGLPGRDVLVAPAHCLLVEGCLIPARLLADGIVIRAEPVRAPVTYLCVRYDRLASERLVISHDALLPVRLRLAERTDRRPRLVTGSDHGTLYLLVEGRRIGPVHVAGRRYRFVLPHGARSVRLLTPADAQVAQVTLETAGGHATIPADHPALRVTDRALGVFDPGAEGLEPSVRLSALLPLQDVADGATLLVELRPDEAARAEPARQERERT